MRCFGSVFVSLIVMTSTFSDFICGNLYAQDKLADIIIVVDNSSGMEDEENFVQSHLNEFTATLALADIDYRLVLISAEICVPQPTGSGSCPNDTKLPNYLHIHDSVGSSDALDKIVNHYPTWASHTRSEAFKHIIVVSDDDSNLPAGDFDVAFLALDANHERYKFHAIASPEDPVLACLARSSCCPDFISLCAALGQQYVDLASQTDGVFNNICLQDFGPFFDEVAQEVIQDVALPQLTVSGTGSGNGTISSSPAGISCGIDCQAAFPVGTDVTLIAIPGWGSEFAGWTGDVDCEDGEVTIAANLSCYATFVPCSIAEEVTLTGIDIVNNQLHQACNRLVVGPSVNITDTGNGVFRAGNEIEFNSNFDINTGGGMSATLGPPCGIDPTPPGGTCPGECTGGCSSNRCVIDCSTPDSCQSSTMACPQGFDCEITCGQNSCTNSIVDCPGVYGCNVSCAGDNACENTIVNCSSFGSCNLICDTGSGTCDNALILCGNDSCSALCANPSGSTDIACGNSCKCEHDC